MSKIAIRNQKRFHFKICYNTENKVLQSSQCSCIFIIQMKEQSISGRSESKLVSSRQVFKQKNVSKLSAYETNMQNFSKNQKFNLEKVDPKGITAVGVYGSFSGVIEDAQLFSSYSQTLQLSYHVCMGDQWHDETPETDDTEGASHFCEAKNGKATFSLSFDFLASCMFIASWPKIVITLKGFNYLGQLVPKGYAHIDLPTETGQCVKKAHLYSIIRNESWYQSWLPFLPATPSALDEKEVERVIVRGERRESEKIRSVGVVNVRVETLLRNFERFGYK